MIGVLKKGVLVALLLFGLMIPVVIKADGAGVPVERITKGSCAVGYIQKEAPLSLQENLPGYHLCEPALLYQFNLILVANEGAISQSITPAYRFKSTYTTKGVKVLPDPLLNKGKMILFYYQNLRGKLATIEAYCLTPKGYYGKYSTFDVYSDENGIKLKNLKKFYNTNDNGTGCLLDIYELPYVEYKSPSKSQATLHYVYDVPPQCKKGQEQGLQSCKCPHGLILENGNCVSKNDKLSIKLNFKFIGSQQGLKSYRQMLCTA